jgi:hypothetical protein
MDYEAIGWLALQLYSPANSSLLQQAEISFAIWDIFPESNNYSTESVYSWLNGATYGTDTEDGVTGSQLYGDVLTEVAAARTNAPSFNLSTLTIYSPDGTGTVNGTAYGTPQEFITVQTPEASSLANLAVDLLLLAGAVFFACRRRLTSGLSN